MIDYEGGSLVAALDGNGFGGDDGNVEERGTYYACSTGSGAGCVPLALALLVLRRRRRA
ncbi:MAG: hypothetical protein JWP01_1291 [Myxococcales bacterium]|nr:hypothetical protein [Myxococcales bacterium]